MERVHFILLLVLLYSVFSFQDRVEDMRNKRVSKKYCGMYLTTELSVVCHGNYNTLKVYRKRDVDGQAVLVEKTLDEQRGPNIEEEYPFLSKEAAKSFTSTPQFRRRLVRGVVNECCEKPCSYDELRSYCGSDEDETQ